MGSWGRARCTYFHPTLEAPAQWTWPCRRRGCTEAIHTSYMVTSYRHCDRWNRHNLHVCPAGRHQQRSYFSTPKIACDPLGYNRPFSPTVSSSASRPPLEHAPTPPTSWGHISHQDHARNWTRIWDGLSFVADQPLGRGVSLLLKKNVRFPFHLSYDHPSSNLLCIW